MSMHPKPESQVPEETARVARAAFPKGNDYLTMRDELEMIYTDSQFASLFSQRGQSAQSPWLLAMVTILQFAEGLSDRQAADAVRSRIDWKYLLGLALEDAGFDFSVLSEFRDRLIAGKMEQQLLDHRLIRFRERGLLKARGKQRTDSTHVQSAIRNLNRLELVGETMRHALNTLAVSSPVWLKAHVPSEWYERYGPRFEQSRLPQKEMERENLALQIGQDGRQLMLWAYETEAPEMIRKAPAVETLRCIWVQQYYIQDEAIFWVPSDNTPPAELAIQSPYDPEARFSIKRQTEWLGYKAHLTETCDEDQPHLITHVATTVSTVQDEQMTAAIHQVLEDKDLLPKEHLLDRGYVDTKVLIDSRERHGIEVIGPIKVDTTWQAQAGKGFDVSCFTIDWERQKVTCPKGRVSQVWTENSTDKAGNPRIYVRFAKSSCQNCSARADYTRSVEGPRTLSFKPKEQYELLQWARQREHTPEFKKLYAKRAGIEGTISQGTRSCGLRRSRYIGQTKTHLQHILIAIAINLARFVDWIHQVPRAATRTSAFAALAHA
ncbi:MAG: IS1182 family transposase [Chloroflexi bacterium]|nr:MAG: IS1182 family transposase [Chloroflexota bacterium]